MRLTWLLRALMLVLASCSRQVAEAPRASKGILSTPTWTAESDQTGAEFGHSAASAGDVNGDGYGDLIVGAPYYDNGEIDEGRAFLYLGSANGVSVTAAWTGESDRVSALFGMSVASAGDVNADGYGDVVVGAEYYENGEIEEGRAFLYLGSPMGLLTTAAWTAESDEANAGFGHSVASAGDVNGDGYGDVVVGAPNYNNGKGRAFLHLGSATGLLPTAAWTAESDADTAFGRPVASAGDVNADGYGDVVVGANGYMFGTGRAFLYMGSATGLSLLPNWTGESDQFGANFGESVASTGDVNGDGFGDVVVGAPSYDNALEAEGRAFLYLGSAGGLSTTAAWTAESDQAYAVFGDSVASAGDVDGDGYGDVVVGAHGYDNGQMEEGRAYLYLGSPSGLSATPVWMVESDQATAWLGVSAASAGDVNADGYGDIVVGAPYYDNGQLDEGRAFLYQSDPDGDGIPDSIDNCPLIANPFQEDTDLDGLGDACEPVTTADAGTVDAGLPDDRVGDAAGAPDATIDAEGDNAGCGCRVGSPGKPHGALWLAVMLAALVIWGRRSWDRWRAPLL